MKKLGLACILLLFTMSCGSYDDGKNIGKKEGADLKTNVLMKSADEIPVVVEFTSNGDNVAGLEMRDAILTDSTTGAQVPVQIGISSDLLSVIGDGAPLRLEADSEIIDLFINYFSKMRPMGEDDDCNGSGRQDRNKKDDKKSGRNGRNNDKGNAGKQSPPLRSGLFSNVSIGFKLSIRFGSQGTKIGASPWCTPVGREEDAFR